MEVVPDSKLVFGFEKLSTYPMLISICRLTFILRKVYLVIDGPVLDFNLGYVFVDFFRCSTRFQAIV